MRRPHCSTIQHPTQSLITACLRGRRAPSQYYHPYQRSCKSYRIRSRLAMSCGFRTSDPDQLFFQIYYLCMSRSVVTHSFPTQVLQHRIPYSSLLPFPLTSVPLPLPCLLLSLTPSSVSSRTLVSADWFKIQPQFEDPFTILIARLRAFMSS